MEYELRWINAKDEDCFKSFHAEENISAISEGLLMADQLCLDVFSIIKNEIIFTEELR